MKANYLKENAGRRALALNLDAVLGGIVVAALLGGLVFLAWNHYDRTSAPPEDYEGTIVDRWAGANESSYGTRPYFGLLIEAPDGKRTTVRIDPDTYELARVGMRIKSRAGKVILIETTPSPSPKGSSFAPKY
jgi:hypothetical protein